jgi:cytochrome b561
MQQVEQWRQDNPNTVAAVSFYGVIAVAGYLMLTNHPVLTSGIVMLSGYLIYRKTNYDKWREVVVDELPSTNNAKSSQTNIIEYYRETVKWLFG